MVQNLLIDSKQVHKSLAEAVDLGIFNVGTGTFTDPLTNNQMGLTEAFSSGLLDGSRTLVTDPATGEYISMTEALNRKLVNEITGEIFNRESGTSTSFIDAVNAGIIVDAHVPPSLSFTEANRKGLFDSESRLFTHPVTGVTMFLEEAINTGLLDPDKCIVYLPDSTESMSLASAMDENLVDEYFDAIVDPRTKRRFSLFDTIQETTEEPDFIDDAAVRFPDSDKELPTSEAAGSRRKAQVLKSVSMSDDNDVHDFSFRL